MNRPNPTKPQQFEKKKTAGDRQAKHILSEHTSTDIIREAEGIDIRFWKALAQMGGWGGQTWHNSNFPYCLSTCSVINTIYTIYCAIIKNVKIHKYIF